VPASPEKHVAVHARTGGDRRVYKGPERREHLPPPKWKLDKTISLWQVGMLLGVMTISLGSSLIIGVQWSDKQTERIATLEHNLSVQAD
jgi:hypothetical protein